MKSLLTSIILLISVCNFSLGQDTHKLFGVVTDFNSNPIDGAVVILRDKNFKDLHSATSDESGRFSMQVPEGLYYCLFTIKLEDYGKTKLEYWAWNIPVYGDIEINPQYDEMEIYGINAYEPRVTPYNTYAIYFRPMSLAKSLKIYSKENRKDLEERAIRLQDTIDVAPDNISREELSVKINEAEAQVLTIQKIVEYARGAYIYGYLVQVLKPENGNETTYPYDKITIILHSFETDEFGKGELYIATGK